MRRPSALPAPWKGGFFVPWFIHILSTYPHIHTLAHSLPSIRGNRIDPISGHTYIWTGGRSLEIGGDLELGREGEGGKKGGKEKSPHNGGYDVRE